jgi:tetratricopeptide (TPR) repeat protein
MLSRRFGELAPVLALVLASAGCASTPPPNPAQPPPLNFATQTAIVTDKEVGTEEDLKRKGERALMEQRWQDAVDAYKALLAADPSGPHAPDYLFNLALAQDGLQDRPGARDSFLQLATKYPTQPNARAALVRAATLDAFLEDWKELAAIGDTILARQDIDEIGRLVGLGARGLANVELGNDRAASKDINDGLDLADQHHYGAEDVLPVAVGQLRFALGELRRMRSEQISFDPLPPDFLERLEERCQGLLQAQEAYATEVRSVDPHWASMSGYHVGEMYRVLHRDLMLIPPPKEAKTERQKQLFFAVMHLRYRVLLQKGLEQIEQTIALADRMKDSSPWIARAKDAKSAMETALADEKAQLEKMPFTEADINAALDGLKKKAEKEKSAAGSGQGPVHNDKGGKP